MNEESRKKIEEAGREAIECRRKGFHCSESVFTAVNETLKITDPSMVRMVTGFHGGGGTHRKEPGINLTEALEAVSSGKDKRPREDLPYTQVGHLCGALTSSASNFTGGSRRSLVKRIAALCARNGSRCGRTIPVKLSTGEGRRWRWS